MDELLVYTYYKSSISEVFYRNILSFIKSVDEPIHLRILCTRPLPEKLVKLLSSKVESLEQIKTFTQDLEQDYLTILSELNAPYSLYIDPNLFFIKKFSIDWAVSTFFVSENGLISTDLFFIKKSQVFDRIRGTLKNIAAARKLTAADLSYVVSNNFLLEKTIVPDFIIGGSQLTNDKFNESKLTGVCIDSGSCIGSKYTKLTDYLVRMNASFDDRPKITLPHIIKRAKVTIARAFEKIENTFSSNEEPSFFKNPNWPTVIIPVYKNLKDLSNCLDSILSCSDQEFNLLVINDSPNDTSVTDYLVEYESLFNSKYVGSAEYRYLINEVNLGFVKTTNLGMSKCEGDVILLNSDTIVSNNWITRLVSYKKFNRVASVTPLSNSASICSFPKFNTNQSHYRNLKPSQIDSVFSRIPQDLCHEAPTGVGFCMLMTREAIDQIGVFDSVTFKLGYGEENDWCMRAIAAGFKNLIAPNVYVAHEHGASFKAVANLSSIRLDNARALSEKHPNYNSQVQAYLSRNELSQIVPILIHALDYEYFIKTNETTALIITHGLGGGSTHFSEMVQSAKQENGVECIRLTKRSDKIILSHRDQTKEFKHTKVALSALIHALGPDSIMLNHSITWDIEEIHDIFTNITIPFGVYLHDFYWVCPNINMMNNLGKFCGAEKSTKACDLCFTSMEPNIKRWANTTVQSIGVAGWRRLSYEIFRKSQAIACPSENTKSYYVKYFPEFESKIAVWSRETKLTLVNNFSKNTQDSDRISVISLGGISKIKGSDIIYEMHDLIKDRNLPIDLTVIGTISPPTRRFKHEKTLSVTGQYSQSEIGSLIAKRKPSVGLILSIIPETYSYTTSELFSNQIPILCFNIGAQADRVKEVDGGWVIDQISAAAVIDELIRLHSNREEIIQKHFNLSDVELSSSNPKIWFTDK